MTSSGWSARGNETRGVRTVTPARAAAAVRISSIDTSGCTRSP
ncbi:MAG TPA: hypothetical protein VF933_05220 [Streptosporangiaceae bacterium]